MVELLKKYSALIITNFKVIQMNIFVIWWHCKTF